MKLFKNSPRFALLGCVAISTLGLLAPSLTLAEGKGASKLMFAAASPAQLSNHSEMSCPRCTEGYAKVADKSAKGMQSGSVKTIPTHLCPSCQTKIASMGVGKAKTDKVTHTCGMNGSATASCCMAAK